MEQLCEFTAEGLRNQMVKNMLAVPKLGKNYVDWHTADGKCGLTLIFDVLGTFDITIEKRKEDKNG